MNREKLFHYFFFALLALVLWQIGRMLAPFAGALTGAFVLAIVFYPLYRGLDHRFPRLRPALKAFLISLVVCVVLVLPLVLVLWGFNQESEAMRPVLSRWETTVAEWRSGRAVYALPQSENVRSWLYQTFGIRPSQVRDFTGRTAEGALQRMKAFGRTIPRKTFDVLAHLGLMVVILFFFLRDGPRWYDRAQLYIPISADHKTELHHKITDTVSGVVRGWLLTAIAQGVTAAIGYLLAGVPGAILLGILTALCGLLPVIGTALVWAPIGLLLISFGDVTAGCLLLLYGALLVSSIDNFLRPYLVGSRMEVPFLALLLSILGGVWIWGLKGVFLGPVIWATAPVLLEIYRERYLQRPALSPEPR